MNIWIIVAVVTGIMLVALMFRFMQPELIYAVRKMAVIVTSHKAFLLFRAEIPGASVYLDDAQMRRLRYEMRFCDADYALERVGQLSELYRILDPGRNMAPELRKRHKPQVCIVELGEIIKSLGKQVEIFHEAKRPTIGAAALLKHLASEINKADNLPSVTDDGLEYWLMETPISVEQAVELVSAGVIALAYRVRAQEMKKVGELLSSDPGRQMSDSIRRLERTLRFLLRAEYERKFGDGMSHEIELSLGAAQYRDCLERMKENREQVTGIETDVIDLMYLAQLVKLLTAQWDLFSPVFGVKDTFEARIQRIISARSHADDNGVVSADFQSAVKQDCDDLIDQVVQYRKDKH
jgi:hypothetical protein